MQERALYLKLWKTFKCCTINERAKIVKRVSLCFNCLRSNHQIKDCTEEKCKKCTGKHHTLLHKEKLTNEQFIQYKQSITTSANNNLCANVDKMNG